MSIRIGGVVIIVIDGYNLIKQLFSTNRISHAKRDGYVDLLINQSQNRGHRLIIVFDGGEFGLPSIENRGNAQILYSGYRESADDVIKRYVSEHRSLDLLVVTSDRAIHDFVRNLGIRTLKSLDFSQMFFEEKKLNGQRAEHIVQKPTIRLSKDSTQELDDLMMSTRVDDVVKYSYDRQKRIAPAQKESKKERAFNKKLRKL
jgi:predicted RNA-binding protein with PIN domain